MHTDIKATRFSSKRSGTSWIYIPSDRKCQQCDCLKLIYTCTDWLQAPQIVLEVPGCCIRSSILLPNAIQIKYSHFVFVIRKLYQCDAHCAPNLWGFFSYFQPFSFNDFIQPKSITQDIHSFAYSGTSLFDITEGRYSSI